MIGRIELDRVITSRQHDSVKDRMQNCVRSFRAKRRFRSLTGRARSIAPVEIPIFHQFPSYRFTSSHRSGVMKLVKLHHP
jgi:hypothetical protein